MVPPVQHIKSTDEKTDDQLPPWVQSDLDRKIYTATDANVLLGTLKEEKFNSRTAANIIAALGKFVENGKLTASTFQSNPRKNILEDNLCSVKFQMNTFGILQAIKSLMMLGYESNSKVINTLENEVLWTLRKANVRTHFQVISHHSLLEKSELQNRVMKTAVENIQRRWVELSDPREFASVFYYSSNFSQTFINKIEDVLVELVESFSQTDRAKIVIALASHQRRSTPLLRSLSYHLTKTKEVLPCRLSIDVLYALSRLSFYDQPLIDRLCNDLIPQLTSEMKSSSMRSLFNALGQLKYRHESLLDASCEWMNQNWDQVRSQDAVSLLKCLAMMDYTPTNWETLRPQLDALIQQSSPQWDRTTLLDVKYSLAVLKQLEPTELTSLLNDSFIQNILENNGPYKRGAIMKINQLWALSQLEKCNLSDLTMNMPLKDESQSSQGTSSTLATSVMEALSNFVPGEKFLRQNEHTILGLNIEGECILDSKCVALQLSSHAQGQPLPANFSRVAMMVMDYKDHCLGSPHPIGSQAFRERLLTLSAYKVIKVSFLEFNPNEKMVKKVQILQQLIKSSLPSPN